MPFLLLYWFCSLFLYPQLIKGISRLNGLYFLSKTKLLFLNYSVFLLIFKNIY